VRYAVVASSGVWRSLVARFVRDEEAVGSNPATPTMVSRFKNQASGRRWCRRVPAYGVTKLFVNSGVPK
jgi:hypothetical protein